MTTASEYADGLRQLADWIEAHPDIKTPETTISCCSVNSKEEAASVLLALKPCRKHFGPDMFSIKRDFGPLTLSFLFYRTDVCTRRVIGTRHVEARLVPEREEEIVEWDCPEALLRADAATEAEEQSA